MSGYDLCPIHDSAHIVYDCPGEATPPRIGPPVLDPGSAALAGLAGDVVRALEPHTEADPAGLLLGVLAEFGAMVGGMAEARAGASHHPPALFGALVGRSSRSRKGTSAAEIDALMRHVEDGWHDGHRVGGFGSGEAFIEHAASQPGAAIYVHEPEFARVLTVASREGSSASSVLRAAWDFHPMQLRTRKQALAASAAPVTLIGHITSDELKDKRNGLRSVEILNGFGNRILWVYVDRRRIDPDLRPVPGSVVSELASRLHEALVVARCAGVVVRSPEADELWRDLYAQMAKDDPVGVIGALTSRAEAQVLRLSLVYALIDGSDRIERAHLESGWEMWRYCRWSAQHIWVGSGSGDPDVDRIDDVLSAGGELDGRDLDRMFLGHRSSRDLRKRAVGFGVAREHTIQTGGRPRVVLRSAHPSEEADKADQGALGPWWRIVTFHR